MTPSVWVSWPAQCDLAAMEWCERELGGVLLGMVEADRVIVNEVRANPNGAQEPTSTTIQYDAFFDLETVAVTPGRLPIKGGVPRRRIVGSVHSHPRVGVPQASQQDLDNVRQASLIRGQDASTFVEMIVAPTAELWEDGFPTGRFDWDDPHVRSWVAVAGTVSQTFTTFEPRVFWQIEDEHPELQGRREEAKNAQ